MVAERRGRSGLSEMPKLSRITKASSKSDKGTFGRSREETTIDVKVVCEEGEAPSDKEPIWKTFRCKSTPINNKEVPYRDSNRDSKQKVDWKENEQLKGQASISITI